MPGPAAAQSPSSAAIQYYSVKPQPLGSALKKFAAQAHLQILFSPQDLQGKASNGIDGQYSKTEAIERLLSDSALTFDSPRAGTVVIRLRATPVRNDLGQTPSAAAPGGDGAGEGPAGAAYDGRATMLEDIVVTARKREESLLDVPIAISAFTAERMQQRNIRTLNDIVAYSPGISIDAGGNFTNDRSQQNIVIRGMAAQPGAASTASVFIDGAPLKSGRISSVDDVERVEVLRGPQSTYFGRSTFAGAINIIPRAPSDRVQAKLFALAGSDKWLDFRASVEGPIIPDKLLARLSGRVYTMDGQYSDPNNPGARFGDQKSHEVSVTVLAKPTDSFRAKLFALYAKDDDGPAVSAKFGKAFFNCNAGAPPRNVNNYICGRAPSLRPGAIGMNTTVDAAFRSQVIGNSLGILNPVFKDGLGIDRAGNINVVTHVSLIMDYDLPFLGLTLSSITAQNKFHNAGIFDFNQQYVPTNQRFFALRNVLEDDMSQELRLTSRQADRFRYIVGASYTATRRQFEVGFSSPFGVLNGVDGSPQETKTQAVFGGAAYDLTSQLTLNLEGRYQVDTVSLLTRAKETTFAKNDFKNFLPRAILQYKFAPNKQVYVSAARGANPGQFNSQFITTAPPVLAFIKSTYGASLVVDPETIDNYEVGFKGSTWGGRAELTVAAYHAIWSNQIVQQSITVPLFDAQGRQTSGSTLFTIYSNIGKTVLNGVEVEGVVAATANLRLDGSASVNDSNIRSYSCIACEPLTGTTQATGKQLPYYSKYKANIGAEYTRPIFDDRMSLYARGDYLYASGKQDSEANLVNTGDSHVVNVRVGVRKDAYYVEAFVNNLTDDRTYTNLATYPDLYNGGTSLLAGLPVKRQVGVRAQYKF